MEPFIPIPGKPPRQVVIDRQRKLFASLNIEDLLLELVRSRIILNYIFIFRESTIKTQQRIKLIGFHWSLLTILNMIAVSQRNGLSTELTLRLAPSTPYQAKDSTEMRVAAASGDQS
jgi:hypothetical protein